MLNNKDEKIYRVQFKTGNRNYSLLARSVGESELFGFIEVADLIFEDKQRLIISPEDDALRKEFARANFICIPHQHILRIDCLKDQQDVGVSYLKIADEPKTDKE
ncbi:MAG: DUF1820 family protein [Deltaproteobacteria bacterium]|jgi:hypothetical protein|nr:DUF1820 family protein [Deltaproteobacteria bacterium]